MQSSDSEKVELYISCRNLKNMDLFSKSDPEVRLYSQNQGKWHLVGKTEQINDNLNPNFSKCFTLDFIFEVQQPLKFEVVDIDGPTSFDFIGSVETTLGKIMGAKKQTYISNLVDNHGKTTGKIIVRGERQGTSQNVISWQWSGVKLMNTDGWFDKSDPFLRFFKKREDGEWLQVHETETIMNNLNPIWKLFELKEDKLCGGDHSKPIRIECWDWESNGKFQYIGDCEITIEKLKNRHTEFELHNPKKKKKTGTLRVLNFAFIERPSFLEYIRGGEQLSVVAAIDFTGSNGHPSRPDSLHARNMNGQMNQYQKAITSVCQILLNYDYDQKVPVFGFGGKPRFPTMTSTLVSHCFPCSGDLNQNEVLGLDGILAVYNHSLDHVELSGPTYFAPIITEAIKLAHAQKVEESGVYTILLILTDGEIHDMDQTIEAICSASHLPLSIIIVGVGNADFSKMEILDGDDGLYNAKGQKAQRDLVQFVPFRNFQGDMVQLAKHVLAEVPDQLVDYMRLVGRKPKPPLMVDINQVGYDSGNTLQSLPSLKGGNYKNPSPMVGMAGASPMTGVSPNMSPMNMQVNQELLNQNPYLMNPGMHMLVQNAMGGMQTSVNNYASPITLQEVLAQNQYAGTNFVQNVVAQEMPQNVNQPGWMTQQSPVDLQSFGMTESVNMGPNLRNQQNYMPPKY